MTDIAISIKNLTARYDNNIALQDINIDVKKGEFLALIGPNGGGKSTLIKAILRLAPFEGKIEIFGQKKIDDVGYVPQISSAEKKFPISVLEVVLSGLHKKTLNPFSKYSQMQKNEAMETLERLGIEKLADRQIDELSGGEFQKTLLCRALLSKPKILLLDEPTANIDPSSAKNIYELLKELNKTITIVMATHDLFAVSDGVTRLACLNKTLVYHGEPQLTLDTMDKLYGCPVDLIAHGIPHRVLGHHGENE
ncbi:MAG TPA: metal ABC transporter ATP-binding protein [Eubacteriales bacterium]|nr:metal ABC transporter ATP-binding protein [Eubacteriales bacterium]